jgi:hypothetical protein
MPLVRPARHSEDDEQKTRLGIPAYEASARMVTEATHVEEPAPPGAVPTTQAVRVIVWHGPDGVHVAPYGTRVAAPAIDALLVAMDPSADLAAWLTQK